MLDFSFVGIEYGWLRIKIQVDHEYVIWFCDEALSDPIPGMIRMYNALKEGKDASWRIERGQELSFHTEFRGGEKEYVWLTVRIDGRGEFGIYDDRLSRDFYDKIAEESKEKEYCDKQIVVEEKFVVDVLLYKFEIFFHLLTSSRLYPCHYPCWWYQEDDDSVHDEADKIAERYPELDGSEIAQLELLYYAEHCILTEEGERFYKEFDNMMRTHKVPNGWG